MIAALDLGLKRIGIALGYENGLVIPQKAVIRKNRNQAALEVSGFLKEWKIEILVVGIPFGGSSEDEMKRRIKHFVSLLEFEGKVVYVDESFSSKEASAFKTTNGRKKDGKLDSLSAAVILRRYFDSLGKF